MSDYPKLRGTTQNYKKKYPLFFLGKLYKIGIVLDIGFMNSLNVIRLIVGPRV